MAWTPIDGSVPQYSTEDNELASGYYLKFYQSGTTTPFSMATDSTGNVKLAKCKLNARGMPITNPLDDDTVFIPHVDQTYRIVLYKNETDADNDTTASAEYNVDGIAPNISPTADASDITLRTNSMEAWDDYDRSPLFVDGTDFTAGAGPHTITVPSGWDPTDSDMRFWRLDAPSDSVESLTPTSVTSSSFTLAETLLSTDVLFIGDDQFRNIHDGDPADILNRLLGTSAADGAVSNSNLEDDILSADADGLSKMADGFLSADAAGRAKMADSYVSTPKLSDGVLTADTAGRAKMADDYVNNNKLAADAVTNVKVQNGTLGSEKFQSGADERDWVLARTASASVGVVGTYAFLQRNSSGTSFAVGDTIAGSILQYVGINLSDTTTDVTWDQAGSGSPAGTWRAMGESTGTAGEFPASLFLRIA